LAYENDGLEAVEEIEAPILMYPLDEADPKLAEQLVREFGSRDPNHPENGLIAADLRWGVWPDAAPVPIREEDEPIGVHLNTFGIRQMRYGLATEPEKRGLEIMTSEAEELVRDALDLRQYGAAVFQFGKIPTLHRHVVAREDELDGLVNWKERQLVEVSARREMRARLISEATPERMYKIAIHIGEALGQFVR
jgi:hypothetical protein